MSKLIMWNVITLDGYFQGKENWDINFHDTIWGDDISKFGIDLLKTAGHVVYGRVTYEGMADYWKTAKGETAELMNAIPKLVFSKTLKSVDWNNATLINENASEEIRKLKNQDGKDLYVFGSANLSETFINDDLYDEYILGIAPIISGSGKPLFATGIASRKLSLISSQPLTSGGIIVRFENKKE